VDPLDPNQFYFSAQLGPKSRTALLASGNTLYLLDQNTGLHVFDTAVPEPATWTMLLAAGVAGVALRRWTVH